MPTKTTANINEITNDANHLLNMSKKQRSVDYDNHNLYIFEDIILFENVQHIIGSIK